MNHTFRYAHVNVDIYIYIYMCMSILYVPYVYICIYIYVHVHVCLDVYAYAHLHAYEYAMRNISCWFAILFRFERTYRPLPRNLPRLEEYLLRAIFLQKVIPRAFRVQAVLVLFSGR